MYEKGFAYLFEAEHEKLIYGVLKKLHVMRTAPIYEDLLQEARISYAKAYEEYYKRSPKIRLNVYLYQNVTWRLLDLLRKENKLKLREANVGDEILLEKGGISSGAEKKVVQQEFLLELYQNCRPLEQECLILLIFEEKTPTEVALRLGVSRQTVYNLRKKLQEKYKRLNKENEKG